MVVLLDQIGQGIKAGHDAWGVFVESTMRRIRPTMLTRSVFWGPLAVAIMGGHGADAHVFARTLCGVVWGEAGGLRLPLPKGSPGTMEPFRQSAEPRAFIDC